MTRFNATVKVLTKLSFRYKTRNIRFAYSICSCKNNSMKHMFNWKTYDFRTRLMFLTLLDTSRLTTVHLTWKTCSSNQDTDSYFAAKTGLEELVSHEVTLSSCTHKDLPKRTVASKHRLCDQNRYSREEHAWTWKRRLKGIPFKFLLELRGNFKAVWSSRLSPQTHKKHDRNVREDSLTSVTSKGMPGFLGRSKGMRFINSVDSAKSYFKNASREQQSILVWWLSIYCLDCSVSDSLVDFLSKTSPRLTRVHDPRNFGLRLNTDTPVTLKRKAYVLSLKRSIIYDVKSMIK